MEHPDIYIHYISYMSVNTQECVIMNCTISYMIAAQKVHEATVSLVRYWFVRSSLQTELQETFKKNRFLTYIIFFPQDVF